MDRDRTQKNVFAFVVSVDNACQVDQRFNANLSVAFLTFELCQIYFECLFDDITVNSH